MSPGMAYFDNAATTMTLPEVAEEMRPYFTEMYGNPSSLHEMGAEAAAAVRTARKRMADAFGCYPSEVFFTAGGTEADNMAILGTLPEGGGRVVTSAIEHSAVLETCGEVRRRGGSSTIVPVDREGFIDLSALDSAMGDDVYLVSVMAANNVIGTIEDIRECARIAHEHGALFHTDAVQGFTKMDIDVRRDGIDMLSVSGHKIHGPKGIGALYVKTGTPIRPIVFGGGQESGLRSSTENVPGIVGIGKAAEIAMSNMGRDMRRMTEVRDRIIDSVLDLPGAGLNGPGSRRLCNNAHFRFDGVRGNSLVLALSRKGVAASTASACSAGDTEPSHVLSAIGLSPAESLSALRVTISHMTTDREVDLLLDALPGALRESRV